MEPTPEVLKKKREPLRGWKLSISVTILTVSLILASTSTLNFPNPYVPGTWPGQRGMFHGMDALLTTLPWLLIALVAGYHLIFYKRWYLVTIAVLLYGGYNGYKVSPITHPRDPAIRIKSELPAYKNAILSKVKFGDQHSEEINGRTLVYWRWMAWGIDNAVGVVYDPLDRLKIEADLRAFRNPTGGVLFRLKKLESQWYFVEHS